MAGRKKLPKTEKKKVIRIFVKEKNHAKAKKVLTETARIIDTEPDKKEV